jgi:hypothetical protein
MAMFILTIFIWSGMISAIVLAANCIARDNFCGDQCRINRSFTWDDCFGGIVSEGDNGS